MKRHLSEIYITALLSFGAIISICIFLEKAGVTILDEVMLLPMLGFQNRALAGAFLSFCVIAVYSKIKSSPNRIKKIIYASLLIAFTIANILCNSRASLIAAVVGVLLFEGKQKAMIILCSITIPILSFAFKSGSSIGRLLIWRVTWDMIKEKPLLGFGPNGFSSNYMLHQAEYFANHPDSPFYLYADNNIFTFNEILHLISEWGILGILVAIFVFAPCIHRKTEKNEYTTLSAVTTAWLVFGMFSYPLSCLPLFLVFISASILLSAKDWNYSIFSKIRLILLSTICVSGIFFFSNKLFFSMNLQFIIKNNGINSSKEAPFLNGSKWLDLAPTIKGDYASFCEIYPSKEREEAVLRIMKEIPSFGAYCAAGEILCNRMEYEKAISLYKTASNMIPSRLIPRHKIFLIYEQDRKYEEAFAVGSEIIKLPIKIESSQSILIRKDVKTRMESWPTVPNLPN